MMKKNINRNIYWATKIADLLYNYGVRNVCISPGSRNTPLTLAFAANKKIKKHIIIDERSSAFFALGLAKNSKYLTAILTTSGTAVAELYPAIIEAYFEKIPLILLTADRPYYLRNSGANQTINQDNIFINHIRSFADLGLPNISYNHFKRMKNKIDKAIKSVFAANRGPIHFNIPFEKPFEPSNFTDYLHANKLKKIDALFNHFYFVERLPLHDNHKNIFRIISSAQNILIISGNAFEESEKIFIPKISKLLKAPVISGILSPLRFSENVNVIKNASNFLKDKNLCKNLQTDLILQFGFTSISSSVLDLIAESKAIKIAVNPVGEKIDPSLTTKFTLSYTAETFYNLLSKYRQPNRNSSFVNLFNKIDTTVERAKREFISNSIFNFEWKIYHELTKNITNKSNFMISNSLPIRDFDFIISKNKNILIHSNRGASGIDGIISTASGIYQSSMRETFLIIGDLAFQYDLNALYLLKQKNIPLKIILINNNGGGIFELLPIAKEKVEFEKYFKTPINMSFKGIVESFGGMHFNVSSPKSFHLSLNKVKSSNSFSVFEFFIDSKISTKLRNKFWQQIEKSIRV